MLVADTASHPLPAFCKPSGGDASSCRGSFTGALDADGDCPVIPSHAPLKLILYAVQG